MRRMLSIFLFSITVLSSVIICSCQFSRHPLYKEADLVQVPYLVGKWEIIPRTDSDAKKISGETWMLDSIASGRQSEPSKPVYYLTNTTVASGRQEIFIVGFIILDKLLFIDVQPTEEGRNRKSVDEMHIIGKVDLQSDTVTIRLLTLTSLNSRLDCAILSLNRSTRIPIGSLPSQQTGFRNLRRNMPMTPSSLKSSFLSG